MDGSPSYAEASRGDGDYHSSAYADGQGVDNAWGAGHDGATSGTLVQDLNGLQISSDSYGGREMDTQEYQHSYYDPELDPAIDQAGPSQQVESGNDGGHRRTRETQGERPKYNYEELGLPDPKTYTKIKHGRYYCRFKPQYDGEQECKEPNRAFDNASKLKKHVRQHVLPVVCPKWNDPDDPCGHRTAEQREMDEHFDSNHKKADDRNSWECPYCGKEIKYKKYNLSRHINKMHPGQPVP